MCNCNFLFVIIIGIYFYCFKFFKFWVIEFDRSGGNKSFVFEMKKVIYG